MTIVCPHCATFFAIDPARLGPAGRMVRCARCKEIWLARPEETADAAVPVLLASADAAPESDGQETPEWRAGAPADMAPPAETPIIDSPSIAAELPGGHRNDLSDDPPLSGRFAAGPSPRQPRFKSWLRRRGDRPRRARRPILTLPVACVALAALAAGLVMWRAEIVRLLPQTALFYRMIGLEVNLRGLAIRDVKVTTETVDAKQVLVIEGNVVDIARKAVDLPRLRFVVRDARGVEIYAWNAVLEQARLKPGEKTRFRSRLATPPQEARHIDVRFFNRHDLATSGV
ncbi:MAG: zinc-ribbon domain-containing protein [Xanthobacteraceae bacterium]|nr:zinc-ribbon domain-containing protein [Xanthobacteraceae bacterium]